MMFPSPRQHLREVPKIAIIVVALLTFLTIVLEHHTRTKNNNYPTVPQPQSNLQEPQEPYHNTSFVKGSPRFVLIVAYMHTGSSYLTNIFQEAPETFYLYEPLISLLQKTFRNRTIKYLNGTEVHMTEDTFKHVGSRSVVDMFSCNYSNLDIATLTDRYAPDRVGLRSRDLVDYVRCLERRCILVHEGGDSKIYRNRGLCGGKYFTDVQETHRAINTCLRIVVTKCQKSNVRVLKMIRMSMDMTELALQRFPNMQIIHLLRDPRAMLDSNHRRGELGVHVLSEYIKRTKLICDSMATDLRISEQLKSLYPGRIFTLRYEDMVKDPMGIAKTVHDFAHVPFTNSAEKLVRRESMDVKKNSTVRASAWRGHIDQTHLDIVENACYDLFQMLGYKKLAYIKEVRNLAVEDHKRDVNIQ